MFDNVHVHQLNCDASSWSWSFKIKLKKATEGQLTGLDLLKKQTCLLSNFQGPAGDTVNSPKQNMQSHKKSYTKMKQAETESAMCYTLMSLWP